MLTTQEHNKHIPASTNTEYVNADLQIKSFVNFKRKLIALKHYSKNSVINAGTLDGFCSSLISSSELNVKFWCNTEIKQLFNTILYS